jgi:uncharacterized UBP type Zn finger protein
LGTLRFLATPVKFRFKVRQQAACAGCMRVVYNASTCWGGGGDHQMVIIKSFTSGIEQPNRLSGCVKFRLYPKASEFN